MKRRVERREMWGEGWLMAAALAMVLVLCLVLHWQQTPPKITVQPVHAVSQAALMRVEMVDLNGADAAELATLPGIGDALAQRIVEYRREHGDFSCIEEIMNVLGIGAGKFEVMRDSIYVESA